MLKPKTLIIAGCVELALCLLTRFFVFDRLLAFYDEFKMGENLTLPINALFVLLALISVAHIVYGLYLKTRKGADEMSKKTLVFTVLISGFYLYSFLLSLLVIAIVKPMYEITNSFR